MRERIRPAALFILIVTATLASRIPTPVAAQDAPPAATGVNGSLATDTPHPPGTRPEPLLQPELVADERVPRSPSSEPAQNSSPAVDATKEAAQALKSAATALEKSSKALEGAADKLADKKPTKTLLEGFTLNQRGTNGAFFKFSEKEKVVTGTVTIPVDSGSNRLSATISAPLDEDTRIAALADHSNPLPFQLKLGFEHDAIQSFLEGRIGGSKQGLAEKQLCDAYRALDSVDEFAECGGPDYEKYRREYRQATEAMRLGRPFGLQARPVPQGVLWTVAGEVAVGIDRKRVYESDLAAKPDEKLATALTAAAIFRWYPLPWLAIPLRAGLDHESKFKTEKVKRCATRNSSDNRISGSTCEEVLWLKSGHNTTTTAHVEAAAVLAFPVQQDATLGTGFEIRDRIEGIGKDKPGVNKLSVAVFVSATTTGVLSRFGVGVEHRLALQDDASADPAIEAGDSSLIPFLVAGGTL